MKSFKFALFALLTISGSAFARDSRHLECTGFVPLKDQSDDKVGLSFHYDDVRDATGAGRDETVSVIYQQDLFQSVGGSDDQAPAWAPLRLVRRGGKKQDILFKGDYQFVSDDDGNAKLKIKGFINYGVGLEESSFSETETVLPCIDLSI